MIRINKILSTLRIAFLTVFLCCNIAFTQTSPQPIEDSGIPSYYTPQKHDPEIPWEGDPDLSTIKDERLLQIWDKVVKGYRSKYEGNAITRVAHSDEKYTTIMNSKEDQAFLLNAFEKELKKESVNWDYIYAIQIAMLAGMDENSTIPKLAEFLFKMKRPYKLSDSHGHAYYAMLDILRLQKNGEAGALLYAATQRLYWGGEPMLSTCLSRKSTERSIGMLCWWAGRCLEKMSGLVSNPWLDKLSNNCPPHPGYDKSLSNYFSDPFLALPKVPFEATTLEQDALIEIIHPYSKEPNEHKIDVCKQLIDDESLPSELRWYAIRRMLKVCKYDKREWEAIEITKKWFNNHGDEGAESRLVLENMMRIMRHPHGNFVPIYEDFKAVYEEYFKYHSEDNLNTAQKHSDYAQELESLACNNPDFYQEAVEHLEKAITMLEKAMPIRRKEVEDAKEKGAPTMEIIKKGYVVSDMYYALEDFRKQIDHVHKKQEEYNLINERGTIRE